MLGGISNNFSGCPSTAWLHKYMDEHGNDDGVADSMNRPHELFYSVSQVRIAHTLIQPPCARLRLLFPTGVCVCVCVCVCVGWHCLDVVSQFSI